MPPLHLSVRGVCALALTAALMTTAAAVHAAELPYAESFGGADGAPWPAPWFPGSAHVTVWDLQGGRARLDGDAAFVARMILPGFAETDVEVGATFEFEDVLHQGIGFYVRQNGGTLQEYLPHGQGYALFLKGAWGWPEDLGLWREIDGVETQFATGYDPVPGGLEDGVRYRLRYRVTQADPATTLLQAKVWTEGGAEPAAWTVESTDTRPELQGTPGSFALDIYNYSGSAHVFLDDVHIEPYPATTGVPPGDVAPGLALAAPCPHPIAGPTELRFTLPERASVTLAVHDPAGRLVARPFAGSLGPGAHAIQWDSRDRAGRRLRAGVYFMRVDAGARRATRRIVIAG